MPKCSTCALVAVRADGGHCKACLANAQKNTFLENSVLGYLKQNEDLKLYTYADKAIPCAPTKRRPDFCYVLPDRVVILEVDEHEHRYNTPECETRRELELLDAVPADKHLVIVRFNPNPKRSDFWSAFDRLGSKLREAFVTDDVKYTDDGIHRIFINYSTARKRKLAQTATADQLNALRLGPGARAPETDAPNLPPKLFDTHKAAALYVLEIYGDRIKRASDGWLFVRNDNHLWLSDPPLDDETDNGDTIARKTVLELVLSLDITVCSDWVDPIESDITNIETTRYIRDSVVLHCVVDDNFPHRLWSSTLGKICFLDGVYTFATRRFSPYKDAPDVYTAVQIQRKFPRERNYLLEREVRDRLLNPVFNDDKAFQRTFMLELSRGLAGCFEDKRFIFTACKQNSGQDSIRKICFNAAGPYIEDVATGKNARIVFSDTWPERVVSSKNAHHKIDANLDVSRSKLFMFSASHPEVLESAYFEGYLQYFTFPNMFVSENRYNHNLQTGINSNYRLAIEPEFLSREDVGDAFLNLLFDAYSTQKKIPRRHDLHVLFRRRRSIPSAPRER